MAIGRPRKPNDGLLRLKAPPAVKRGRVSPLRGLDIAERILDTAESGKTLIYFDPDADGMLSGFFYAAVLTVRGIRFRTYINSNRRHGFMLNPSELSGWTVLTGDFLVSRAEVQELVNNGVNLLSIDHHECEPDFIHEVGKYGHEGVVINNQYPFEPKNNRFQSGAGVVFEALREIHPGIDTKESRALVAISLLTDIRNIQNELAAGYLHELYNHPYEGYFEYLMEAIKPDRDFGFGVPKFDRNYTDYNFGPAVNSMLRYNEEDAAVNYILGGGYPKVDFRGRQREFVREMQEKATLREFNNLRVLEVFEEDFDFIQRNYITNFIGLLCSRYSGDGHSCIGIVYDTNGNVLRSSFRGNLQKTSYLEVLSEILVGVGHNIAFGILEIKPSEELWKRADAICAEVEKGTTYQQRWLGIDDLSKFRKGDLSKLAELNSYLLGPNRVYLRYAGENIDVKRGNSKYTEFSIDGEKVMTFNTDLEPAGDYILAILDRGRLSFFLDAKYQPKYALEVSESVLPLGDNWYTRLGELE